MVAPLALMMIVFVFGGVVGIASFQLRKDLRERVLQRYADIWGPISRFQVARGMDDELLSTLNREDTIVYSLMEGQDIDGALGVQVFDSQGRYLAGVPAGIDEADLDLQESGQLRSHEPWGRLTEGNSSDRQQSELESTPFSEYKKGLIMLRRETHLWKPLSSRTQNSGYYGPEEKWAVCPPTLSRTF